MVERQYYGRRFDGVDLYRYAVPNVRTEPKPMGEAIADNEEKYWQQPQFKVMQHPSEQTYDVAIDVDSASYTYTETDTPIEGDTDELAVADTLQMLNELGVSTDD